MSELRLTLTERFRPTYDDSHAESIRSELGRHFRVGKPQMYCRRSGIELPSIIELVGAVLAWKVLWKSASAFLGGFFDEAGRASWDRLTSRKSSSDIEPLVDVVKTLIEAADRVGGTVHIGFGLNIPDNSSGTVIWADSRDPMQVARNLAELVVNAEKLDTAVQSEIEGENKPIGPILIELGKDGSMTIRWKGQDFKTREVRIR